MKYIVTGGCGFIGSHLIDLLMTKIQPNDEIHIIDNLSTGRLENIKKHLSHPQISFHQKDLVTVFQERNQELLNPDYVFHLAGLADIVPSIENPQEYFHANVQGTLSLLEFLKEQKGLKKLVYAASSSCYGIPDHYPTPEDADIRPMYPYALTKRMGEELILHWSSLYDIPSISLRLFNVYGPRSRTNGTYGAVFGVFMAQILADIPLTVVGDGSQSRDFTFVTDVASAFWMASQSSYSCEVFNVGSGDHYSVKSLVKLLDHPFCTIPKRPGEPDQTFADTKKIKTLLKWTPCVSFEEGVQIVKDNIGYYKDAPVWTPDTIKKETQSWFKALSKK
ncbi:MAG: NAD-dependent dehydratase [Halobacteriovoraceae bacterium]|nr:NAD-dependent dehydratase [Halobacteriovoraceae bacterium]|tara:strand:- start:70305 stop:71309 length:1005 start_codon:yes stop_codon:yes gene_type:complete